MLARRLPRLVGFFLDPFALAASHAGTPELLFSAVASTIAFVRSPPRRQVLSPRPNAPSAGVSKFPSVLLSLRGLRRFRRSFPCHTGHVGPIQGDPIRLPPQVDPPFLHAVVVGAGAILHVFGQRLVGPNQVLEFGPGLFDRHDAGVDHVRVQCLGAFPKGLPYLGRGGAVSPLQAENGVGVVLLGDLAAGKVGANTVRTERIVGPSRNSAWVPLRL
mmetsp:Transcript_3531/g.9916  ORF Transcript_3531/g.9916 Transcript_3531/m.9916 type:complete len:217 (-) Transcript_3531:362-1012(-)